jgi:hypothetical protein
MHISFSGVITPYTYNCPYAHMLKNVKRVKIPKKPDEEKTEEYSRRMRGIDLHNQAAEFIVDNADTFEFTTDTLLEAKATKTHVEKQFFFDVEFSPLEAQPDDKSNFISMRCDTVAVDSDRGKGTIYDWKFANSEYGISKHYDELEFFIAGLSALYRESIGDWDVVIHFPEEDYTLPIRSYSWIQTAHIQQVYIDRVNSILLDRFYKATPSKFRCRFCAHRSADTGGSDFCEYTVI